jgi:hypothetical protein
MNQKSPRNTAMIWQSNLLVVEGQCVGEAANPDFGGDKDRQVRIERGSDLCAKLSATSPARLPTSSIEGQRFYFGAASRQIRKTIDCIA